MGCSETGLVLKVASGPWGLEEEERKMEIGREKEILQCITSWEGNAAGRTVSVLILSMVKTNIKEVLVSTGKTCRSSLNSIPPLPSLSGLVFLH